MTVIIEEFTPVAKNTLVGFARVRLASGLVFHDVGIHKSGESCWASVPSKPMVGRDGAVIKDVASGKPKYVKIISFVSRDLRDKFSNAVVEALRLTHPTALGGGGA